VVSTGKCVAFDLSDRHHISAKRRDKARRSSPSLQGAPPQSEAADSVASCADDGSVVTNISRTSLRHEKSSCTVLLIKQVLPRLASPTGRSSAAALLNKSLSMPGGTEALRSEDVLGERQQFDLIVAGRFLRGRNAVATRS
jgi:hypothetical protein